MADGKDWVASGFIAAVVTYMEMKQRPRTGGGSDSDALSDGERLSLERWHRPSLAEYRRLFRLVGEPWLWFSRLVMDDAKVEDIVHNPAVEVFAIVDSSGTQIGMLELDFRQAGECELGFVGLVPGMLGKGHGRWLMAEALGRAWRSGIRRVWLHTCTLDHPGALRFYLRAGFMPFARKVERFADPRLFGIIARDAAPHIPVIDPDTGKET